MKVKSEERIPLCSTRFRGGGEGDPGFVWGPFRHRQTNSHYYHGVFLPFAAAAASAYSAPFASKSVSGRMGWFEKGRLGFNGYQSSSLFAGAAADAPAGLAAASRAAALAAAMEAGAAELKEGARMYGSIGYTSGGGRGAGCKRGAAFARPTGATSQRGEGFLEEGIQASPQASFVAAD